MTSPRPRRLRLRNDTTAALDAENPLLAAGEVAVDITLGRFKVGDGTTRWADLEYFVPGGGGGSGIVVDDEPPESPSVGDLWVDTTGLI